MVFLGRQDVEIMDVSTQSPDINLSEHVQGQMSLSNCGMDTTSSTSTVLNSSPPGQNGRLFADDIFRCIFVNEKFCILIKISLKFVPKSQINNNPALV